MSPSSPYWGTVMDMDSATNVQHGKRLMPVMVDEVAVETPDRVCFSIPRSADLRAGFHDITFQTFANAINKTASFIEREIGRSSMFETVMYMGLQDMRHFIVLFALMKTGHKVLFSSHRNSVAGHTDLIKRTDCGILLYTTGISCAGIIEASRMESLCMPELDYLLDDSIHADPYPYTKTFEQAKHHPCMVTHTSGSTGMPKPVIWSHWMLATTDAQRLVPDLDGRPTVWNKVFDGSERCYSGLPIYHSAGIFTALMEVLLNGCAVVLGPAGIPAANVFEQVVTYGRVDAANLLPSTLEEIASIPTGLALLRRLKYVAYAGGSLSHRAGDILSRHTHLYSLMASTESGPLIQHATDREDWQYVCINPKYSGIEWRPQERLFELIFKKSNDLADIQGIFKTSPRSQECSMSDLYSKHPTKAHHWKHEGRTDDMIVFRSGFKFNPTRYELTISSHPLVQHCILVGTGKDVLAAIIELRPEFSADPGARHAILTELAPTIDEANSLADATGQLRKHAIIFAQRGKPFLIAGKGTVQRKATIALYQGEIDDLYARMRSSGAVV